MPNLLLLKNSSLPSLLNLPHQNLLIRLQNGHLVSQQFLLPLNLKILLIPSHIDLPLDTLNISLMQDNIVVLKLKLLMQLLDFDVKLRISMIGNVLTSYAVLHFNSVSGTLRQTLGFIYSSWIPSLYAPPFGYGLTGAYPYLNLYQ